MSSGKTVDIYDVKVKNWVKVPAADCRIVTKDTSRGPRTQLIGKVTEGGKTREVYMFVKKDFKL